MENISPLSRCVRAKKTRWSLIVLTTYQSRTYLLIFVACDLLNLILQGMGGGICSTQQRPKGIQAGINIVIAGLATQVASLFIFILCCLHFANNVRHQSSGKLSEFAFVRESRSFRAFLFGSSPLGMHRSFHRWLTAYFRHRYRFSDIMHIYTICISYRGAAARFHWATCQQRNSFHGLKYCLSRSLTMTDLERSWRVE